MSRVLTKSPEIDAGPLPSNVHVSRKPVSRQNLVTFQVSLNCSTGGSDIKARDERNLVSRRERNSVGDAARVASGFEYPPGVWIEGISKRRAFGCCLGRLFLHLHGVRASPNKAASRVHRRHYFLPSAPDRSVRPLPVAVPCHDGTREWHSISS